MHPTLVDRTVFDNKYKKFYFPAPGPASTWLPTYFAWSSN